MDTQENREEIQKKGVKPNPSRDIKYADKEKNFSGEFEEQIESAGQEVNSGELETKKSQGRDLKAGVSDDSGDTLH